MENIHESDFLIAAQKDLEKAIDNVHTACERHHWSKNKLGHIQLRIASISSDIKMLNIKDPNF